MLTINLCDIQSLGHEAAAAQIAKDDIHILIDLKGFTENARPEITALRPAPIIVNWLGYPGTLGHERLADYLISDAVVTPPDHANAYSETLALMPHCYQPNDRMRRIGATPNKSAVGLPENAFVFCSFNSMYKISPEVFDVWCDLLNKAPRSVLWLLQPSDRAAEALRREAGNRGIDPARMIFAPKLPLEQHLGRLQLADLALDTYPVNSHTTGSDALWAGVPLVTRIGETFASRVAASLLHAANLPDLVAADWNEYTAQALFLATNPNALAALKKKMAEQRDQCVLFDTRRFTQDLEWLYREMWLQFRDDSRRLIVRH